MLNSQNVSLSGVQKLLEWSSWTTALHSAMLTAQQLKGTHKLKELVEKDGKWVTSSILAKEANMDEATAKRLLKKYASDNKDDRSKNLHIVYCVSGVPLEKRSNSNNSKRGRDVGQQRTKVFVLPEKLQITLQGFKDPDFCVDSVSVRSDNYKCNPCTGMFDKTTAQKWGGCQRCVNASCKYAHSSKEMAPKPDGTAGK